MEITDLTKETGAMIPRAIRADHAIVHVAHLHLHLLNLGLHGLGRVNRLLTVLPIPFDVILGATDEALSV
jgi:hypothetical protein